MLKPGWGCVSVGEGLILSFEFTVALFFKRRGRVWTFVFGGSAGFGAWWAVGGSGKKFSHWCGLRSGKQLPRGGLIAQNRVENNSSGFLRGYGRAFATMQNVAHALRGKRRRQRGDLIWQQLLYLHAFADVRSKPATIGFWPRLRRAATLRSCRGIGIWR